MLNEEETRAQLIDPKLRESGWTDDMIQRDRFITKGMIINESGDRLPPRKPDYILYYPDKSGVPIAVIEAEAESKSHLAGMQQAKEYMERLGVPFAYSTNGHKIEEYAFFLEKTFYGQELKGLPYLIGVMNCILHGLLLPNIERRDTFEENIVVTPKRRFDIILTNPPFGGKVAKHLQDNLPVKTSSTELTALQYCMRKLNKGGRCGIVLPEGVLFRGGAYKRVKMELLRNFNVHTIVSLPTGTFAHIAPKGGTGPKANLVFFDKTGPTKEIWYYELQGNYTKANPVKDEDLVDCFEKWKNREISENSWIVPVKEIIERDYDLTARNPNREEEISYPEPEELIESVLEKERQILKILQELREFLR